MRFKILFLFSIILCLSGSAQELPPSPVSDLVDSATVSQKKLYPTDSLVARQPTTENTVFSKQFDKNFREKYKSSEFDYTTVKPTESVWQKIMKRVRKIMEAIFGKVDPNKAVSFTETVLRIFAVVIAGFVLYFLIKFLMGKDGNFFFSKKNKKVHIANQDLNENIHEINFSETIAQSERQHDYRSAVRYQFLSVLKILADRKLINWNPEKTNKDYLEELKSSVLEAEFKELAHIFDYVWYGEFEVNEESYRHFKKQFLNFKR